MSRPHWPLGMTRRPTPSYSDQALDVAQEIDDPAYRAWPLGQVAAALATAGGKTKDARLLDQAVTVAEKVSDPTSKVIVLSQVATVTQGPPGLLDSIRRWPSRKVLNP